MSDIGIVTRSKTKRRKNGDNDDDIKKIILAALIEKHMEQNSETNQLLKTILSINSNIFSLTKIDDILKSKDADFKMSDLFEKNKSNDDKNNSDTENEYDDEDENYFPDYIESNLINEDDYEYIDGLGTKRKNNIERNLDLISNFNDDNMSEIKVNIIESKLSVASKSKILQKIKVLENMPSHVNEYHKLKDWVNCVSNIPFNKYIKNPWDNKKNINFPKFIEKSKQQLDKIIYGHDIVKNKFLEILAQWKSNPKSNINVIGLCGPVGIGKTSLIKNGLSNILNRPCGFISLGGATDSSYLNGHSYTYEGSKYGKITSILMETKCNNPIIYFDELDKVSQTKTGDEINKLLIHLTDLSQNDTFEDRYVDIPLDLSKCLFIFSFNHKEEINPILLNRMHIINMTDFKPKEKIIISNDYILPRIFKNYNIKSGDININNEILEKVISKYNDCPGLREIIHYIDNFISRINLLKHKKELEYPVNVNSDFLDKIMNNYQKSESGIISHMYI